MARRILVLIALAALAAVAIRPFRHRQPPLSVLVVTLDTTRADRLPPYGYLGAPMPALERLAREGIVFDRAYTVAPLTLPAHCSLFTGLLPAAHGVRDNADPALAGERTTLAEILRARGYRTGAFVGSVVLDADRGLAQGFDTYAGVPRARDSARQPRRRPADAVVDDALKWLEAGDDSPFLAWVHLYDAHAPYAPAAGSSGDPYVASIALAAAQVGRLIDALDRRRLLGRTIVVIAGDHGEGLGEHGEREHGLLLFDSVLQVPLIVRAPGLAPRRIAGVARIIDVLPTLLDLVGIDSPPVDGVDLAPALRRTAPYPELDAYSETDYPLRFGRAPVRALRSGRYKLIAGTANELYDLDRDPFEQHDLAAARLATSASLARRLETLDRPRAASARAGDVVPADLEERLAALGYVSGRRR